MAVSPGGLGTLLALILIGPVIYSGRYVWKKLGFVTLTKYLRRPRRTEGEEVEGLNEGNGEEDDDHKLTTNDYLFAMVGYAIGIGNVWRFPYVIATNGGSAALLAYIICAIFVAVRSIISHYTSAIAVESVVLFDMEPSSHDIRFSFFALYS